MIINTSMGIHFRCIFLPLYFFNLIINRLSNCHDRSSDNFPFVFSHKYHQSSSTFITFFFSSLFYHQKRKKRRFELRSSFIIRTNLFFFFSSPSRENNEKKRKDGKIFIHRLLTVRIVQLIINEYQCL